ncbi:MAG TPA: recombinase RecA, partial [Verrucomicrobiae bacterium]
MPPKTAEKTVEKPAAADLKAAEAAKASATRARDLDAAISSITKAYGDGSIMRLGDARSLRQIEVIPTGALAMDLALGVGGIPRGRVVEIFGPESSGKTTLMLHVIANAQKTGGLAAFIDAEHALDPGYAKKLGVNLDDLLVSQPDSGEEALTICETLARSNALDVIVIDSVAALVPKAELEGEMGMATMGMQARLMSQALRKLTAILAKAKTTCVFTNQMREKVGVMFGNPETTPGGKALKFYASVRIDIRRKETLKDAAGNAVGN